MARIVDYDIIEYIELGSAAGRPPQPSLAQLVREKIKKGWRPYGTPFTQGKYNTIVCQAMVKVESDTRDDQPEYNRGG